MSGCLRGRIHELFGSGGVCDRGQAKCNKETEAYGDWMQNRRYGNGLKLRDDLISFR